MNNIETIKLALEALEEAKLHIWLGDEKGVAANVKCQQAIESLHQAIEQAQKQEPVSWESILGAVARGWCYEENANKTMDSELAVAIAKEVQALYTSPPSRQPLTDEEIEALWPLRPTDEVVAFARAIEAAHGIKGEA